MTIIGSAYVDIRAITDQLEADIKKALATLPDKIEVKVDADTKAAEDQIDLLVAWADEHRVNISVHADTSVAETEITAAAHNAEATINVDADTALAAAHMDAFVHEEDGQQINVPVDIDDAVARGKLASLMDSIRKFSDNKPIQLFDSNAIQEAEKQAKRLGEDFKAPIMYRISTQASEDALTHLKATGSNVGEFLSKLGGTTQLLDFSKAAIQAKINLGEHSIALAAAAEKAAMFSSAIISAAGNVLSLGSSLVQMAGMGAALPGVFVGLEIAMKLTSIAFSDMKKAAPELAKEMQSLKDIIAKDFWAEAQSGLQALIGPTSVLRDEIQKTSTTVGAFWGAMFDGMSKGSFAKAMAGDFDNLNSGIKIMTGSSETFLHIFQTLGEFGSTYIPKLAQSLVDVSARFDAFLTKANADGTLKRWVDQGVESFKGLVSVVTNTSSVIGGLMKAATDAGGASLGVFGAAMERLAAVIKTPEVQTNLVNIFSGANAAIDAVVKGLSVFMGSIGYLSPALKVVETDAGRALQAIIQIFAGILANPAVFNGLQDMFTGIVTGIGAFTVAIGPVGDKLGTLLTIVGMVADSLGHVFANALATVLPIVKDLLVGIEPLIYPLGDIATSIVNTLAPALKILVDTAFPPLISLMTGSVLPALQSLVPVLGTMLPPVVAAFSDAIAKIAPIVADLIPKLVPLVEALIKIGAAALPPILSVLPGIVSAFSAFYSTAIAPLIGPLTDMVTGFLSMKGAGEVLAAGIAGVVLAIVGFNAVLGLSKGILAAHAAITAIANAAWVLMGNEIEGVSLKTKIATIAQAAFNLVMDANPIMLVVIGVAALIAGIILLATHWDEVTKAVGDFVNSTGSMLNDFNKNTQGMFNDFFASTGSMFTDFFNNTVGMFKDFVSNTVGMFSDFGGKVKGVMDGFFSWWGTVWAGIIGPVTDVVNSVVKFVQDNWNKLVSIITDVLNNIIQWVSTNWAKITKVFSDVWKGITDGVNNAMKFISDVITNVTNFIGSVWSAFWNSSIGGLIKAVMNLIQVSIQFVFAWMGVFINNTLNAISTVWHTVWGAISSFFTTTWNNIVNFVTTVLNVIHAYIAARIAQTQAVWGVIWGAISTFFINTWNNIVNFVTTVLNVIHAYIAARIAQTQAVWAVIWGAISAYFIDVWNNIVDFVTTILNVIHAYISARISAIQAIWSAVWAAISDFFTTIWNNIVSFVTGAINNISNVISGVMNSISSVVNSVLSSIGSFFSDTWNNISSGVSNAFNTIVSTVSTQINNVFNLVNGIKDKVVGVFSGAGTWLLNSGQAIVQGLINGINDMINSITGAINNIAKIISDHMPHSPAKRGPLSGKGYTSFSGQALAKDLAVGMLDQVGDIEKASNTLALAARPKMPANANIFAAMNATTAQQQAEQLYGVGQGALAGRATQVVTPTVNVYPSAPLNETQVGQMAAKELYWNFINRL